MKDRAEQEQGRGVRLLTGLLATIVVMAGATAAHASGGWPPMGVVLAVGVVLLFLFSATRMLEEGTRKAVPVRLQSGSASD